MLLGLTIRDVVLIDRLDLAFHGGLCVLTGETGAGKSILLDALGLAVGVRAESGLVRHAAEQAVVTAEFSLGPRHPARRLLADAGLDATGDTLVLRRVVAADGRSRAFIDDQPASVGLLKQVGETLVEIQGQFEQQGLLDPATHREALDAYGVEAARNVALSAAWRQWRERASARDAAASALAKARADEDYLRHAVAELDALDPVPGEEARLAEERTLRMNREKLGEALESALGELRGERGGEHALHSAQRQLERLKDKAGGRLDAAIAALDRAALEAREAVTQIETASRGLDRDGASLDKIEERLFALKALARKHNVAVAGLPALRAEMTARIAALDDGGAAALRLARQAEEARREYVAAAERVGKERRAAAKKLDAAVMKEFAPLKLEKARFATVLTALEESEWGPSGAERVHFEVATNPGTLLGPLARIASGGELSRFMLALKVVMARTSPVPTLVFDEVDSGIGGAVAAAVGERLHRLGEELQVLVVTHSPQVAARGAHHWRVAKQQAQARTLTKVEELSAEERCEEIARMLSGSAVTAEARAAAASLMAGARP
ncbi:MAG TPA: DNA repair protein RecN [Stellaceae bacterium]|jgi:DNA repair protein RecN (Recombination protein N)|nr:DNA repair protein RecN [Stellaceae bacterium]